MAPKAYQKKPAAHMETGDGDDVVRTGAGSASAGPPSKALDKLLSLKPGEPLGQCGAQAVKDHLVRLEKQQGWSFPLEHWKSTKSYSAKREIAMKLALDRTGAFFKVLETQSLQTSHTKSLTTGWLHIWEVADVEKFPYRPDDQGLMDQLLDFVSDCASRPSEKPALAAKGVLQYDYSKRLPEVHAATRKRKVEVCTEKEATAEEAGDTIATIEDPAHLKKSET